MYSSHFFKTTNSTTRKRRLIFFIIACYRPITNDYWTGPPRPATISEGARYRLGVHMPFNDSLPLLNQPELTQRDASRPSSLVHEEVSFLRLPEVKSLTGLSKSSLYALIRENSFPAPVQLGPRTVAWVRSEIRQWAAERIMTSRTAAPASSRKRTPQRATAAWPASKKWA